MTSPGRRYRLDPSVQIFGTTIVGGSPLRLFRVTESGRAAVAAIASGSPTPPTPLVERLLDAGVVHPITGSIAAFTAADVTVVVPAFGPPDRVPDGAVVVDDGSEPPIEDATIRLDANRGPAAARNAGLARVTTPVVAFVDSDVALTDDWLAPLLSHFDDPRVGAVAPRVRSRSRPGPLGRYERRHSPLDLGVLPARVRAGSAVSYVPAAVLVCRTAAVREIGGFDETLRFGEDVDLVWRLDDAGWWVRYEPAVEVEHEARPSWPAWLRQRVGYGSSAAPLAARHPGRLAPLRMSGWSLGAWLLGVIGRPVLGAAVGVGSAAALIRKLPDVPARAAFRLAATGNLRAGDQIGRAVRRAWLPLIAVASTRSRAARGVLAASLLAARHPVVVADDAAYCVGLWRGMVAGHSLAAIVPDIVSWPGRTSASSRHQFDDDDQRAR